MLIAVSLRELSTFAETFAETFTLFVENIFLAFIIFIDVISFIFFVVVDSSPAIFSFFVFVLFFFNNCFVFVDDLSFHSSSSSSAFSTFGPLFSPFQL
jgi:uncharacterized membrane protein